jgi:CHAD domain-containing protein
MDEVKETTEVTLPEVAESQGGPPLPVEVTTPEPLPDAWEKVRELALRHLDRFVSLEAKVLRGDDPDAIHDIRVASRRLQQVVDLLYPRPRDREIRRLRRKIRRCRRSLSEVRNCDVLLQRIQKVLARKRTARREVWTAVEHYLRQRRSDGFQKGLRKLSKLNLAVFYVRLKDCLSPSGNAFLTHAQTLEIVNPDELVPDNFPDRACQALDRVWHAFEDQVSLYHRDPRAPVLHGVRVAAKRLRYLVEVFHEFGVPGGAESLAWLRMLQQHLGDWHDLAVLEQVMIEMVARPEFLRDHLDLAMGVEKLILANRRFKKVYEEKYFQMSQGSAEFNRMIDWAGYVLASPSAAIARG